MIQLSHFAQARLLISQFPNLPKSFNRQVLGVRYEKFDIGTGTTEVNLFQSGPSNFARNNRTSGKLGQFYACYLRALFCVFLDNDAADTQADVAKIIQNAELKVSVTGSGEYIPRTHVLPYVTDLGNILGTRSYEAGTTGTDTTQSFYPASLPNAGSCFVPYRPDEEIVANLYFGNQPAAGMKGIFALIGPEAHRVEGA